MVCAIARGFVWYTNCGTYRDETMRQLGDSFGVAHRLLHQHVPPEGSVGDNAAIIPSVGSAMKLSLNTFHTR